jgi:hypothetical protein
VYVRVHTHARAYAHIHTHKHIQEQEEESEMMTVWPIHVLRCLICVEIKKGRNRRCLNMLSVLYHVILMYSV